MSNNKTTMNNSLDVNEVSCKLPPPGGGLLVRPSTDDDRANGNRLNSLNDSTSHTLNASSHTSDRCIYFIIKL